MPSNKAKKPVRIILGVTLLLTILNVFTPSSYATEWFSITLLIAESLRDEDTATGYSVRMTFSSIPGLVTPMLWAFIVTAGARAPTNSL